MPREHHLTLHAETLWISPYVFSSFVALRAKGVPFEVEEVALIHNAHQAPAYRDGSVTAKVPALVDDDFWLAESSAIAEYLEDVLPPPRYAALLPADARERARARQVMAWLRSDLGALRDERPTTTMFYERATTPLSPGGEEAARKLVRVAEQLLTPGARSLFAAWSLADSELAFMLHRLILNGHDVPARVRAFADAEWRRPAAQEFIRHPRPATVPAEYWSTSWNAPFAGAPVGSSPGAPSRAADAE
jgi:glutathione S-transferase